MALDVAQRSGGEGNPGWSCWMRLGSGGSRPGAWLRGDGEDGIRAMRGRSERPRRVIQGWKWRGGVLPRGVGDPAMVEAQLRKGRDGLGH